MRVLVHRTDTWAAYGPPPLPGTPGTSLLTHSAIIFSDAPLDPGIIQRRMRLQFPSIGFATAIVHAVVYNDEVPSQQLDATSPLQRVRRTAVWYPRHLDTED